MGGNKEGVQQCRRCSGQGVQVQLKQIGPGMMQQLQTVCSDCGGEGGDCITLLGGISQDRVYAAVSFFSFGRSLAMAEPVTYHLLRKLRTVLCCVVLCCVVLCDAVLCGAVFCDAVFCDAVLIFPLLWLR